MVSINLRVQTEYELELAAEKTLKNDRTKSCV